MLRENELNVAMSLNFLPIPFDSVLYLNPDDLIPNYPIMGFTLKTSIVDRRTQTN